MYRRSGADDSVPRYALALACQFAIAGRRGWPYDPIFMRWLADLIYLLVALVYLPVAAYNALILGKNRRGWGQRLGFVARRDPDQRRVWLHAVSLGEINATPRLIEGLRERLDGFDFVVSTTTDTGHARAVQLYGADRVFRFPLDFSRVVARVLRRVNPSLIVLVEQEVWYNLTRMATRRGTPVVVVNGRLTARSTRRLAMLGGVVRPMFRDLAWVGAQDEAVAARFRQLGTAADRVEVTSSLKWDSAAVTDDVEGASALARALGIDHSCPLWVCGSTGPGEEAMVLQAYRRLVDSDVGMASRLAIVPRKPERFDEVARLIERGGFSCVRRTRHPDGVETAPAPSRGVLLGDTMGELRKFYSLADAVFVGRTLVPLGGSDPMEVAALQKPIVMGPHVANFLLPVEALARADAIRTVDSVETLVREVTLILGDVELAQGLACRARQVVLEHQGATARTIDGLMRVLEPRSETSAGGA